jgi:hypothetical protein
MSMPNIPKQCGKIDVTLDESVNLILASIGYEELALAHIMNAEGEKLQSVLGTLHPAIPKTKAADIKKILEVNKSVNETLKNVMKKELLLLMKLDSVKELMDRKKKHH